MKEGVERLDLTNIIPVRSYLLYIAVRPFEFTSTETATCNAILENTEDGILPLEDTCTSLRCKGISISWSRKTHKDTADPRFAYYSTLFSMGIPHPTTRVPSAYVFPCCPSMPTEEDLPPSTLQK